MLDFFKRKTPEEKAEIKKWKRICTQEAKWEREWAHRHPLSPYCFPRVTEETLALLEKMLRENNPD